VQNTSATISGTATLLVNKITGSLLKNNANEAMGIPANH
jgi:hypothetical protein